MFSILSFLSCKSQNNADEFVQKAYEFEQKGNYKKSIELLNKAIDIEPNHSLSLIHI